MKKQELEKIIKWKKEPQLFHMTLGVVSVIISFAIAVRVDFGSLFMLGALLNSYLGFFMYIQSRGKGKKVTWSKK